ncbi:MAG: amidohydrolase family protein [Planctomycetes bacterium]|nr:amidohydrolase family protein [Planctomycetota bacterium]
MPCIHGKTVYTGTSVITDGFVAFNGSTLTSVGPAPRGKVVGEYDVITPAFIDPHSHIGMHRSAEPAAESEANEKMDALLVLPDALDSVQMDDGAFAEAIEMGVLYSCAVPGSGNILGGLAAVIRHDAPTTTDALIARAGLKCAFGYNPMSAGGWKGTRPSTRMGAAALLRGRLDEVRLKMDKRRRAAGKARQDLAFTAAEAILADVLAGRQRLRCHVHKSDDIAALLRIVDEFKLKVTVEHASDVHDVAVFAELKRRRIPVVYGPVESFPYKVELRHESWRNVRLLVDSGVQFGLMTDHPVTLSRNLFGQTRWFTRCGLSKQQAIELVTRRNATILGIDDRLGTLGRGKWASFVAFNGDPFDITSYPVAVWAEGRQIYTA